MGQVSRSDEQSRPDGSVDPERRVARCLELLRQHAATLATAESLTGGLLSATVTGVAGASAVYRGGVVAYALPVKADVLGVSEELLERHGPVHEETAAAMARAAARLCEATYALATTGVAGPEPHGQRPVGTVFVGCAGPSGRQSRVVGLQLAGERSQIRHAAVVSAVDLLYDVLAAT